MDEKELNKLRRKIDDVDKKIIICLSERMNVVQKIAEYKKKKHILALDTKRWEEVIDSKVIIGKSVGLPLNFIQDIYVLIHKQSLKVENKIINNL